MKDVVTLAVFAAKVLCLMVFVAVLKARRQHRRHPDVDETGRLQDGAFGNAGMRPERLCSGFAHRR